MQSLTSIAFYGIQKKAKRDCGAVAGKEKRHASFAEAKSDRKKMFLRKLCDVILTP